VANAREEIEARVRRELAKRLDPETVVPFRPGANRTPGREAIGRPEPFRLPGTGCAREDAPGKRGPTVSGSNRCRALDGLEPRFLHAHWPHQTEVDLGQDDAPSERGQRVTRTSPGCLFNAWQLPRPRWPPPESTRDPRPTSFRSTRRRMKGTDWSGPNALAP